jgi:dihydroorotase
MSEGFLIKGGQVHDGGGGPAVQDDIRVRSGLIDRIEPGLPADGDQIIDASGLIVAPGLIDLHTHVYGGMGIYSVDPDQVGLATGVTTLLDTGSAGALTYPTFHRYVMPQAREAVYALLNISRIGVQGHPQVDPRIGDLWDINYIDVESAVACIKQHPDRIVGTKVRLSASLANNQLVNEQAGLQGAVEAADRTGLPCMVHHVGSNIPVGDMLAVLRPGDIVTHMYHPQSDTGFSGPDHTPAKSMRQARDRGVIFDVGHGVGSFAWRVAEPACQQHEFWPDTISTDIHRFNIDGPVYDMTTTMSKLFLLGMPLPHVIRAVTSEPARAMGIADRCGRLLPGRSADITLLRIMDGQFMLTDVEGQTRLARQHFFPVRVFKDGLPFECNLISQ